MGLEILEEKFQRHLRRFPDQVSTLQSIAMRVASVQQEMRRILNRITPRLCAACSSSCCRCMPVEGWFTEGDYFTYRMLYDPPFALRISSADPRGCAFLGPGGCVLPEDMRPFPCVKVNCTVVARELEAGGLAGDFMRQYEALGRLQEEIWPLLAECLSEHAIRAQTP
jgi:hypothetical protein